MTYESTCLPEFTFVPLVFFRLRQANIRTLSGLHPSSCLHPPPSGSNPAPLPVTDGPVVAAGTAVDTANVFVPAVYRS